jgi:hypothetical protein
VIKWFSSVDWGSVGSNIAKGIADGISAGLHWLIDAAKKAAQAALDAAKGFLGIESPSKVFAGVGQNMMMGWAQGINRNVGLPSNATMAAAQAVQNSSQVNNWYFTAQYGYQSEQSLTQDVRMLQLLYGV